MLLILSEVSGTFPSAGISLVAGDWGTLAEEMAVGWMGSRFCE